MMRVAEKVALRIESYIDELDGAHLAVGEPEKSEISAEGEYSYFDGKAELRYSEHNDGGDSDAEIFVSDGCVRVIKHGAVESDLTFETGVAHSSVYSVPPYKFDCTVQARRIRSELDRDGGRIDLLYNMTIGGAEKSVRMKIWIRQS